MSAAKRGRKTRRRRPRVAPVYLEQELRSLKRAYTAQTLGHLLLTGFELSRRHSSAPVPLERPCDPPGWPWCIPPSRSFAPLARCAP